MAFSVDDDNSVAYRWQKDLDHGIASYRMEDHERWETCYGVRPIKLGPGPREWTIYDSHEFCDCPVACASFTKTVYRLKRKRKPDPHDAPARWDWRGLLIPRDPVPMAPQQITGWWVIPDPRKRAL